MAPLRAALVAAMMAAACGGQMFGKVYEYEEERVGQAHVAEEEVTTTRRR